MQSSAVLRYWLAATGGAQYGQEVDPNPSADGTWHHIAMVFDGTQASNATRLTAYIDGAAQTLTTFSGTIPATSTSTNNTWGVGTMYTVQQTAGNIDDLRIYNRALSAGEITTLYNATSGVCTSPAGNEADIMYNSDNSIMQYCNGTNWISMGKW